MFYLTTSSRHLLVATDGATSLERVRRRACRVPTYPGTEVRDWRSGDRALRVEV